MEVLSEKYRRRICHSAPACNKDKIEMNKKDLDIDKAIL